jgi:hypothetical protein
VDVRIGIPEENIRGPVLNAGLEAVTRLNEDLISSGQAPPFAKAIQDGVRWAPEPPGQESFDHALTVHKRGWGDCDDLAPYRAADLRVTGTDPGAHAVVYKSGPHMWHAVVKRSDGSYEDPSQTAGMRVRPGSAAEGIRAAVVGLMGLSAVGAEERPHIAISQDGQGWRGRADLPIVRGVILGCNGSMLSVTQKGKTPAKALAGAVLGGALLGGCSGFADAEHVQKMQALAGLLKGEPPSFVACKVGVATTREALITLSQLAPQILDELRAHRAAVEAGGPRAGLPFRDDVGAAFDAAVGFSFGGFLKDVGKVVKGATGIIQSVVSLVPGIGTGISAAIGAGMALLEGGGPLDVALNAAFGAIPIPPGIRDVAHMALDAALKLAHGGNIEDTAIASIRSQIPSGLPQQIFDTLAHIIVGHHSKRATTGVVVHAPNAPTTIHPITTAAQHTALHEVAPVPVAQHSGTPPQPRALPGGWILAA